MQAKKIIGVVGQTGSGKTALSYQIADYLISRGQEPIIILADSRTLYKDLNIASAKPDQTWLDQYQHRMVDILDVNQGYTVYQYQQAVKDILGQLGQKQIPVLVGGSGLYFDSVIYDYQFSDQEGDQDRKELKYQVEIFGLCYPKPELKSRIIKRLDQMLEAGLLKEIEGVIRKHGADCIALRSIVANRIRDYLLGLNNITETRRLIVADNLSLAKRQMTWFKRTPEIDWNLDDQQISERLGDLINV